MKRLIIVCPVYNEANTTHIQIKKILKWCKTNLKNYKWKLIIVDNASQEAYENLLPNNSHFQYYKINRKGRGYALKWAWQNFNFEYSLYMDIDLSTNLNCIPQALEVLEKGSNLVVGSRWLPTAKVKNRKFIRTLLSYGYKTLVQVLTKSNISDFQCGFKGIDKKTAKNLLNKTKDEKWFFDTEIVLLAHKQELVVKDIPVVWKDDPDSKVNLFKDSFEMAQSLAKFLIQ